MQRRTVWQPAQLLVVLLVPVLLTAGLAIFLLAILPWLFAM